MKDTIGICGKPDNEPESSAVSALKSASQIAKENGISNMTLDEINAEISAARKTSEQGVKQ